MSDLIPFAYDDIEVRTVIIAGDPWFVARDICGILDIANGRDALSRVEPSDVGSTDISSGGQRRATSIVNESGLYELIFQSRKPEAKAFRRWVTGTVLPKIRKTGAFAVVETREELLARAVLESQAALAEKDARIAELEPKARTFDTFLNSAGDYSLNEAAKVLSRDHNVLTGERRLFTSMESWGWLYRDGKNKPVPYQAQIDNGRLKAKTRFHYHPETGEVVIDSPQVRVTAKGLEAALKHLTANILEMTS